MRNSSDATSATYFPTRAAAGKARSSFVQLAPGPEAPDARDRAGARTGMIILLLGGGLFWLAVAACAAWLLR